MTAPRLAFEVLTPALVGHTITLRSPTTQVTGLLIGIDVEGWPSRTYDGTVSVDYVSVSARFDRDGSDWDVPVTPDMTLEIKEDDQ